MHLVVPRNWKRVCALLYASALTGACFHMAGSLFSAGPVSLDMRWQPGPLQFMRMSTLAADVARLQTQAQWMQVGLTSLKLVKQEASLSPREHLHALLHCCVDSDVARCRPCARNASSFVSSSIRGVSVPRLVWWTTRNGACRHSQGPSPRQYHVTRCTLQP